LTHIAQDVENVFHCRRFAAVGLGTALTPSRQNSKPALWESGRRPSVLARPAARCPRTCHLHGESSASRLYDREATTPMSTSTLPGAVLVHGAFRRRVRIQPGDPRIGQHRIRRTRAAEPAAGFGFRCSRDRQLRRCDRRAGSVSRSLLLRCWRRW
jgi:hypothetical protein